MPEVPATVGAEDFFPDHEVAVVHMYIDGFGTDRFGETWPTATAVILFGGVKNLTSAGATFVDAGILIQIILTGKGTFGAFFSQHMKGVRIQDFLPLMIGFLNRIFFLGFTFHISIFFLQHRNTLGSFQSSAL